MTPLPLVAFAMAGMVVVMLVLFLLFVTGAPATEARAAASRPDYADYRRTTSAFIPWFPRRSGR